MPEFIPASKETGFEASSSGEELAAFQRLVGRPEWLIVMQSPSQEEQKRRIGQVAELGIRADFLSLEEEEEPAIPSDARRSFADYRHFLIFHPEKSGQLASQLERVAPHAMQLRLPMSATKDALVAKIKSTPRCC